MPDSAIETELAREKIRGCDHRIERLRMALEAGDADPRIVGRWIAEVQAERCTADFALRAAQTESPAHITADELRDFLQELETFAMRSLCPTASSRSASMKTSAFA